MIMMNSKPNYPFHLPSVDDLSNSKYSAPEQSIEKLDDRPPLIQSDELASDKSLASNSSNNSISSNGSLGLDGNFVKLARRRANRTAKEKSGHKRVVNLSRPQGRPLSKETRVRLTLVPTLGILYSILVSDTMRKSLKVVKYADTEKESATKTNEELSTRNIISGFSSLLNVQTVRFLDEPSISPNKHSNIPEFANIDDAVYNLFGLTDYSLIRVTRAAATEVGGSVLLKIETSMPGHLYLNDDEDEDFQTVEMNKDYYQESIGSIGDRPSTTFLKKRVARPRYKSDMRIYLIPKSVSCAIYCETRMFKRDLLRGFLNMKNLDRSVIVAFDYGAALKDLEEQGHSDLISKNLLPSLEQVKEIEESVQQALAQSNAAYQNEAAYPKAPVLQQRYDAAYPRGFDAQMSQQNGINYQNYAQYQHNGSGQYVQAPPQSLQMPQSLQSNQPQNTQAGLGYPNFNQYTGNYQPTSTPGSNPSQLSFSSASSNATPQQQTPLPQQPIQQNSQNQIANGSVVGYSNMDSQYLAQPSGLMTQQVAALAPGSYITSGTNDPNRRFVDPYANGQFYYQQPGVQGSSMSGPITGYGINGAQQYGAIFNSHRPEDAPVGAAVGYAGFS